MHKACVIAGSTGLIGSHVTAQLRQTAVYENIYALVRKAGSVEGPIIPLLTDFESLADSLAKTSVDDIYCCLGTTIRKAGSEEAFRKVDYEYPLELAKWGMNSGAKRFFLVSSLGANPGSKVFYNRVKGEIEQAIRELSYESFCVFRPSLLLGQRAEFRPGETIGKIVMSMANPFLFGSVRKYRAIRAETVARAMVVSALTDDKGAKTLESDQIARLAMRR